MQQRQALNNIPLYRIQTERYCSTPQPIWLSFHLYRQFSLALATITHTSPCAMVYRRAAESLLLSRYQRSPLTVSLLDTRKHGINRLIVRYMGDADYCGTINFRVLERNGGVNATGTFAMRLHYGTQQNTPLMTSLFIALTVCYSCCLCPFVYDVRVIWGSVLTEHTRAACMQVEGERLDMHAVELTIDNAAQLNKISSMNYSGANQLLIKNRGRERLALGWWPLSSE